MDLPIEVSCPYFKWAADCASSSGQALWDQSDSEFVRVKTICSRDELKAAMLIPANDDSDPGRACFTIALRLVYGDGIEQDESEGARYCRESANCDRIDALLLSAGLCGKGRGVDQNENEELSYARKWWDTSGPYQFSWISSHSSYSSVILDTGVRVASRAALEEKNWFQWE
jgi:TPR repeat protein